MPASLAIDVESSVEEALRTTPKSTPQQERATLSSRSIKAETDITTTDSLNTDTDTESETEATPLEEVRSQMVKSFRRVDLLDLMNYILKKRKFSVHQRVPPSSSVHLRQFKRQSVFKAIYYRGDEATQRVREVDAAETDLTGVDSAGG